jgi:SAM-dependent methyltransferase
VTLGPLLTPSTNRKGRVAGAAWTYLLPSLTDGICLSLGAPAARSLPTLARRSREVVIVVETARQRLLLLARARRDRIANVRVIQMTSDRLPLPSASVDVVAVTDAEWLRRLDGEAPLARELGRVLTENGSVYLEWGSREPPRELPWRVDARELLWLRTARGEVTDVAPRDDTLAIEHLVAGRAANKAANKEVRSWPNRARHRLRGDGGRVQLGALTAPRPPGYLCAAAASAGVPIDDHRWTLSAPAGYPSKKVVLQLFPPGSSAAAYVVKLAREPRFNDRIENSWVALRRLHQLGLQGGAVVPAPVFAGHDGGLAFAAEGAVDGVAFRARTTARPDCPHAAAAVDWFLGLGVQSADSAIASPQAVEGALQSLLERFTAVYRPSAHHRAFLAAQIARVGAHAGPFPVVFQHGDPGIWNLLIDSEARPVVLDWEAADGRGMPLWDLLYLMRSFGVWVARAEGTADQLQAFKRHFLEPSELGELLGHAIGRFCRDAVLDRELVEPLFFACWMHRALKEASTLSRPSVRQGRYVRLLLHCIDEHRSQGLVRLFRG